MGDRSLTLVVDRETGEVGPAVYTHWNGRETPDMIREAASKMRLGDVSYATARLCAHFATKIDGVLSLGVFNGPEKLPGPDDRAAWMELSHGDAGVFVVDVNTGRVENFGTYGDPLPAFDVKLTEER